MTATAAPAADTVWQGRATEAARGQQRARTLVPALRRTGEVVLISATIFFLATVVTFLLRAGTGITPVSLLLRNDETIDPAKEAAILAGWGLDRPLFEQYATWLGGVLHGDLGTSWINNMPVAEVLGQRIPVSLSIALLGLLIGLVFGVLFGIVAAVTQGSFLDRGITVFTSVISSVPSFVVSIVLIAVFAVGLGWLPAGGYVPPEVDFGGWAARIILPAVALSLDTVADIARQLRNGIVGTMHSNYATGAYLRGFSHNRVLYGHVLRNGAGPALTVLGMKFPALLGGAVITEAIFGLPGYGVYTTNAASYGDVPVVQGALIISVVLVLVFNLIVNAALNRLSPSTRRGV
jgi:peptide/nickel transport system permease protein